MVRFLQLKNLGEIYSMTYGVSLMRIDVEESCLIKSGILNDDWSI